jgi:SAM-dependent methyltransferase
MSGLTEDEQVTKEAYDKAASGWSDYFDNSGGWPLELGKFHKLLPVGKILEIGAGTGRDAKDLVKLGYEYVGTDVSDALLEIARKGLPKQKFVQMSVYDLDFPEKFDGFWASAVLLHIPKRRIDEVLQRIKSTQKPGATGFISIKDGDGETMSSRNMRGIHTERFFALWSREDFEKVLKSNGYEILDYSYRIVSANTHWHMFIVKVI